MQNRKQSINDIRLPDFVSCRFMSDSWVILSPIEQNIKRKIEQRGTPLKAWNVTIFRGITSGYNEAFIVCEKTKDILIAEDPKEEKRLMKRIKTFYEKLDDAIALESEKENLPQCCQCGTCCKSFGPDFTLWASEWEVAYWLYSSKHVTGIPDESYRCIYHMGNLCSVREGRLFACRIYNCQWELTAMQDFEMHWREKLIALHKEEDILWDYRQIIP